MYNYALVRSVAADALVLKHPPVIIQNAYPVSNALNVCIYHQMRTPYESTTNI